MADKPLIKVVRGPAGKDADSSAIIKTLAEATLTTIEEEKAAIMRVISSRTYSVSDLEGMASATTGQVPVKQSDGSWAPGAGGGGGAGDVEKVGTPVNNQVAVWTGDGTLEGTSDVTFDGTTFAITGAIASSDTVTGGSLILLEGAAPSATGGYGKVYVKSADSKLYFKDDSGAEYDLTAASSSSRMVWSEVTGTTQAAAVNNGYITNNAARVVVTLPDTAAVGDLIRIVGKGAGGWRLGQNASESIILNSTTSTVGVGGYIESTNAGDCVEVVCITANTTWRVINSMGGDLNIV